MTPRNSDASTSYKKKNGFPVEESDTNVKDIVPCLLHKKHKVVKLIKTQMQKIQEEGLLCGDLNSSGVEQLEDEAEYLDRLQHNRTRRAASFSQTQLNVRRAFKCWTLVMLLIALFLLLFLMVWISAGPLSNSMAQTPVPMGSFVRTEGLCSLEKKYLLRWGKPEYFE